MELEALLVSAFAPAHLADTIIGDLCERQAALAQTLGQARARAICRSEALRSLPSLATYRAMQSLGDNWTIALPVAAVICGLCVAAIPFWNHLGMGGGPYHVLRLFIIGLILGCIPRGSTLGCALLLLLIGISDGAIDAREFDLGWRVLADSNLYQGLLVDAVSMTAALIALRLAMLIRRNPNSA